MNHKIFLNRGWKFREEFQDEYISQKMTSGTDIEIPHTVKTTALHYFHEDEYQMLSVYQRSLDAPEEWRDQVVSITFEGAAHCMTLYINGKEVGSHHCGYTAYSADISDFLNYGQENLITVKLDSRETLDQPPFGFVVDYMTYGGLYRDVYLEIKNGFSFKRVDFVPEVTEVYAPSEGKEIPCRGRARLNAETVPNQEFWSMPTVNEHDICFRTYIRRINRENTGADPSETDEKNSTDKCPYGQLVAEGKHCKSGAEANGNRIEIIGATALDEYYHGLATDRKAYLHSDEFDVDLWSVDEPNLYQASIEFVVDGKVTDVYTDTIGFRKAEFKADGFYLNEKKFKIRGLNRHQSFPYVGYAMPESMQRYDADILKKELGVNAVRTSHYPQSHYFLDQCDRLGLLVFTEIPGWQHIGEQDWMDQSVLNVRDMINQYRNHTSIIIWGVRINESEDNDEFYTRTNAVAHAFDPSRQTGGVRCRIADKNTNILEDVFTYNDFSHDGTNPGCMKKKKVTNDMSKGYLVTEFNGHMYPTKNFDAEEHRLSLMKRHATVLNDVAKEDDIAGSFGWCMFDYNTHKDFGSGDRICYHGVCDIFRNPKTAAYVYAAEGLDKPVLEVTSSMDIGEHPASNRGDVYIISNADSVRMYKNNKLIKEYGASDTSFPGLKHGPVLIDDFIGNGLLDDEGMTGKQAVMCKDLLNDFSLNKGKMTAKMLWNAFRLITFYHMNFGQAVQLYQKYIGNWGGESIEYRFDAIKDGKVVATKIESPMHKIHLDTRISHRTLVIGNTYDVAEIRIYAVDENENILPFYNEPLKISVDGPLEIIGPDLVAFAGGMTGLYVRTTGQEGEAKVTLESSGAEPVTNNFNVIFES